MNRIATVTTPYGETTFHGTRYSKGKGICIQMTGGYLEQEPYGVLSVNLPEHNKLLVDEREFFVKTWSENEPVIEPILKSGKFVDTGRRVETGFVLASVWAIVEPGDIPN